jgi:hypothetical protein
MNRKDIALTVAGVLATMALAYLFYRQQQASTAASAATSSQDVTSPDYSDDSSLYDASIAYQYASQMSSISVPTVSSTSSTSAVASSVDTSASTAATGSVGETDTNNLISQIISAYATQNTPASGVYQQTDFSGLAVPTIDTEPVVSTTGIPTMAGQALTDAENMLGVNGVTGGAVNPPSVMPVATTTRPVANPIVTTGS